MPLHHTIDDQILHFRRLTLNTSVATTIWQIPAGTLIRATVHIDQAFDGTWGFLTTTDTGTGLENWITPFELDMNPVGTRVFNRFKTMTDPFELRVSFASGPSPVGGDGVLLVEYLD